MERNELAQAITDLAHLTGSFVLRSGVTAETELCAPFTRSELEP